MQIEPDLHPNRDATDLRMMRFLFLVVLLSAYLPAQSADWRFAHPNATLVGGLKPERIINTQALSSAMRIFRLDDETVNGVFVLAGLLPGVSEVRYSVLDNGTPDPDVLALLTGTIDDRLIQPFRKARFTYREIRPNQYLFGRSESLQRALARSKQPGRTLSPVLTGSNTLLAYDFWMAGNLPKAAPKTKAFAAKIIGFTLGLNMHTDLQIKMVVETRNAGIANSFLNGRRAGDNEVPVRLTDFWDVSAEGNVVRVQMNVALADLAIFK